MRKKRVHVERREKKREKEKDKEKEGKEEKLRKKLDFTLFSSNKVNLILFYINLVDF